MFQTVKMMTVAGMIAASLPLLTETANAETIGQIYLLRPVACTISRTPRSNATGFQNHLNFYDNNNGFVVFVHDWDVAISTFVSACSHGQAVRGLYVGFNNPNSSDPNNAWSYFYVDPDLQ